MKKIILSILALIITVASVAGNVSVTTAADMAASIFNTTRGGKVSLVWDGTDGTRSTTPSFYVFNYDGGGFVVISAEDRTCPILAYSETGSFTVDGMPANIRNFFEGYKKEIEYVRGSSLTQSAATAALWKELKTPQTIKNLNTATWDQSSPFNNNCPTVDKLKSVTGCVATAISEVMYYHKWPKSQSGTLPSYTYETDKGKKRTQEGHALASSYDWDSMKSSYKGTSSSVANAAVATLMFDVGVMMQSSYNGADEEEEVYGTGAYSEDIVPMLVKYMDYDSSAILMYRDEMSAKNWSALMTAEIDASRPVLYSGSGDAGGHQFVLDGYGSDDYFHFNWGWSGVDNGLFRLEAMNIDSETDFDIAQSAVVNLKPDESGKPVERIRYFLGSDGDGGMVYMSGTMSKGNTIKLALLNVGNMNGGYIEGSDMGSVTFKYAVCLMDKDNNIKEIYGSSEEVTLESYYGFSDTVSVKIGCDTQLGDKFMLCYKTTGDWTPVEADYSMYNYEYNGKIFNISDAVAVYDFPEIKVDPSGYSAGDVLDLRIQNCQYIPAITWYFDGKELDNGVNSVRLTSGSHTVKAVVVSYKNNTYSGTKVRTETLVRVINVN